MIGDRRRRLLHVVGLATVLGACLVLLGTRGLVSADEGAMVAQLDLLDRTGSWTAPNPEPVVDPTMRALPLELSDRVDGGRWAPFAKHPLHITLLRPAWEVAGQGGVLAVSLAGVVVAAACAGALADRLRPGAGPAALWLTGLGSPLLFDGFQVVGHALGAATFGLAVVLVVRATDRGGALPVAAAAAAVLVTGLIRQEGVLAGLALGAAAGLLGLARRQWVLVGAGLACGAAAAAARLGEPVLIRRVLGDDSLGTAGVAAGDTSGFLSARWSGFRITVLDVGYGIDSGESLLLVSVVLLAAAALVWRLRGDGQLTRVLAVAAAIAALGRMLAADFLVPGLLPALPVLGLGVVLFDRASLRDRLPPLLWGTALLFVGAVVATQYRTGGTGEWGGRYFAVGLPVLVAIGLCAALAGVASAPDLVRRTGIAAVLVVVCTLSIGALRAVDNARDASSAVADRVIEAVDALGVDATISTQGAVSRFAWRDVLDGRRWFTTGTGNLAELGDALGRDGVVRLALVTRDADTDAARLEAGGWRVAGSDDVGSTLDVVLLTR